MTLPSISGTPDITFIIVKKSANDFRICLSPVTEGATVTFENAGSYRPYFKENSPLTEISGSAVAYSVNSGTAGNGYDFTMDTSQPSSDASYPYTIHVETSGNGGVDSATMTVTTLGTVRVKQTVSKAQGSSVKVGFRKEGFSDAVGIDIDTDEESLGSGSLTTGEWSTTVPASATTISVSVAPIESEAPEYEGSHTEVVGSNDGDIDIIPDP